MLRTIMSQTRDTAHVEVTISSERVCKQGWLVPSTKHRTERIAEHHGLLISPSGNEALNGVEDAHILLIA